MNKLVELLKTVETGKVREMHRGPVMFAMTRDTDQIGPTGSTTLRVCRTGVVISITGSYDASLPDDYMRMRTQGLRAISDKLYGDIREVLREALYRLDNNESPKVIHDLLHRALAETELVDEEGNHV